MMQGKSYSVLFQLACLLAGALVLRVFFWHGISPGDPFTYSLSAWEIVQGKWNPGFFYEQTSRWGLLFPLSLSYRWFGVNEFTSMLWPLLTSLGTVLVAYLAARHLQGERAALLAGIIIAIFPLEIIYASQPMADGPLSFWLLLSLYFFLRGNHGKPGRTKALFLLLGGISLGLAYGTKIVALFVLPFFVILLLRRRRIDWYWLWFGLGFLLIFAAEYAFFQAMYGNGWMRIDLARTDQTNDVFEIVGGLHLPTAIWLYPYWMLIDIHYVGLFFILLCFFVLRERQHKTLFACRALFLWAGTLLLVLSFYPLRFWPYTPLVKIVPYLLMFTAPLLIAMGVYLSNYSQRIQWILLTTLFSTSLPLVYLLQQGYRAESNHARAIYAFAQAHSERIIYAHRADIRYLQYFAGFQQKERYKSFRLPRPQDNHPTEPIQFAGSYVAINHFMLNRHTEDHYPPEILHPPATWQVVHTYQPPPHWLREIMWQSLLFLRDRGWLRQNLCQQASRKINHWWPTDAVIIYAVKEN
jgi:4-amino-4-deoxy-L-arabinose transferase-like glycosyltransferase